MRSLVVLLLLALGVAFAASRCTDAPPEPLREANVTGRSAVASIENQESSASPPPVREAMPLEDAAARAVSFASPDSISGVVVDDEGRPVRGAEVFTDGDLHATTDERGAFRFTRRPGDTSAIAIRMVAPSNDAPTLESVCPASWVAWGTHDLRFVLRHKASLVVELVDANGRPAWGEVEVDQPWETAGGYLAFATRITKEGAGRIVFPAVSHGHCTVRVTSGGFATPAPLDVEVVDGANDVTIVLLERARRSFVITDENDAPLDFATVELFAAHDARTPDRAAIESELRSVHRPRSLRLVGEGRSDESGAGTLEGEAGVDHIVRVLGEGEPWIGHAVRLDETLPLRIRMPVLAGRTVTVRFMPPEAALGMREVTNRFCLLRGNDDPVFGGARLSCCIGGTFANDLVFGNVPAGGWTLAVGPRERWYPGPGLRPLAVLVVGASDVSIDVAAVPIGFCRLTSRLVCEVQYNERCVHLQRVTKDADLRARFAEVAFPVETDREADVPCGSYRARMCRIPQALSDEIVDVPDRGSLDAKFRVRLGNIVVRLVDERGKPLRDARVALQRDGIVTRYDDLFETDGDGITRSQCGVGETEVVLLPSQPWCPVTGGEAIVLGGGNLVQSDAPRTLLGRAFVSEGKTTEVTFVVRGAPR